MAPWGNSICILSLVNIIYYLYLQGGEKPFPIHQRAIESPKNKANNVGSEKRKEKALKG